MYVLVRGDAWHPHGSAWPHRPDAGRDGKPGQRLDSQDPADDHPVDQLGVHHQPAARRLAEPQRHLGLRRHRQRPDHAGHVRRTDPGAVPRRVRALRQTGADGRVQLNFGAVDWQTTAWNFPGQCLRRRAAELRPVTPGGANSWDNPSVFQEDTTWSVDNPWAP
ncbi:hypothetical protein GCM10010399_41280 [Dactylosporangium fulvum]